MSLPIPQHALPAAEHVFSVSELTAQIKTLLEESFPEVWVAGEVSNFTRSQAGHVYFTLKDEAAQIRAILWRNVAGRLRFELEDGLQLIARGRVRVYEPRGSYELIADYLQPKGLGALELAFRQLREKLEKEGLFDPAHKKPLPRFPRRVVLVTSPTGAAVRDLVQVMSRRWSATQIIVYPVHVQGDGAAEEIAAAVGRVNRMRGVDVMVVGRGGGSLEDLWAFNEEKVARAIFASRVPVVSAVGHEVDVTIADLVADRRALTPSEAGELVVPNRDEVLAELNYYRQHLVAALRNRAHRARVVLESLYQRPVFQRPLERVYDSQRRLEEWSRRAQRAMAHRLELVGKRAERLAHALESLSPLAVLARGYSVTFAADGETVVRDAADVRPGEKIVSRLQRGKIVSRVEERLADADEA